MLHQDPPRKQNEQAVVIESVASPSCLTAISDTIATCRPIAGRHGVRKGDPMFAVADHPALAELCRSAGVFLSPRKSRQMPRTYPSLPNRSSITRANRSTHTWLATQQASKSFWLQTRTRPVEPSHRRLASNSQILETSSESNMTRPHFANGSTPLSLNLRSIRI